MLKFIILCLIKMSVPEFVPFALGITSLAVLSLVKTSRGAKAESFENSYYGAAPVQYQNPGVFRSPSTDGAAIKADQAAAYQMYQKSLMAAAPTKSQLDAMSGTSSDDTVRPNGEFSHLGDYQSSGRAMSNVPYTKNAGNFLSSSLLPKPAMSGNSTWDFNAPTDVLAGSSFLSPVQMFGVDTTMSSNKNQNYDIRGNIPVPMGTTGAWNQSTAFPSLPTRPLV